MDRGNTRQWFACCVFMLTAALLPSLVGGAKRKPTEMVDVWTSAGRKVCTLLSVPLSDVVPYDVFQRCDLLLEELEAHSSVADGMVREQKLTQQQFVNRIFEKPRYYRQLIAKLKMVAKKVLSVGRLTESETHTEVANVLMQWILDVSVDSPSPTPAKVTAEQKAQLKRQGLDIDRFGISRADEEAEGIYETALSLDESDQEWIDHQRSHWKRLPRKKGSRLQREAQDL